MARQIAVPRQGCRRGQRLSLEINPDHVVAVCRLLWLAVRALSSYCLQRAGQHGGGRLAVAAKARVIGSEWRNGRSVNSKRGWLVRKTASQAS